MKKSGYYQLQTLITETSPVIKNLVQRLKGDKTKAPVPIAMRSSIGVE